MAEQRDFLFDAPSFAPPSQVRTVADRLKRSGVIDIGSNSVRLVVFDGAARSPAYFYNEKVLAGLGRNLNETGRLHPEGRERALAAILRFVDLAEHMQLGALTAVATAAVREAKDGAEFVAEIEAKTPVSVHVASGPDEARLSAEGVLLGWPKATGLVSDIGGSSMEMARLEKGEVKGTHSTRLGPIRLQDMGVKAMRALVADELKALKKALPRDVDRLFLVGGSWRALARIDIARRTHPLPILHAYEMTRADAAETVRLILREKLDDLAGAVSSARRALLPEAAYVLSELLERFDPAHITVSSYGLREGLLYRQMPPELRAQDPLLAAARQMEISASRFPGFSDALYRWVRPILNVAPEGRDRLVRAACNLHDTCWRAHPDHRAEIGFESATQANLGGLTHADRAFLGLALLHRYSGSRTAAKFKDVLSLLADAEIRDAEILGRSMRLGSMISGGSERLLQNAPVAIEGDALTLTVAREARVHAAEAVEKRLCALASAMGLTARIVERKSGSPEIETARACEPFPVP